MLSESPVFGFTFRLRSCILLEVQNRLRAFLRALALFGLGAIGIQAVCQPLRARAAVSSPAPTPAIDFAKDIQPIFSTSCYECHGPDKQKAGLRLDDKQAALKGGDSGPLLIP